LGDSWLGGEERQAVFLSEIYGVQRPVATGAGDKGRVQAAKTAHTWVTDLSSPRTSHHG